MALGGRSGCGLADRILAHRGVTTVSLGGPPPPGVRACVLLGMARLQNPDLYLPCQVRASKGEVEGQGRAASDTPSPPQFSVAPLHGVTAGGACVPCHPRVGSGPGEKAPGGLGCQDPSVPWALRPPCCTPPFVQAPP